MGDTLVEAALVDVDLLEERSERVLVAIARGFRPANRVNVLVVVGLTTLTTAWRFFGPSCRQSPLMFTCCRSLSRPCAAWATGAVDAAKKTRASVAATLKERMVEGAGRDGGGE